MIRRWTNFSYGCIVICPDRAVEGLVDAGSVRPDATAEIIHLPSLVLTCLIGLAAVP